MRDSEPGHHAVGRLAGIVYVVRGLFAGVGAWMFFGLSRRNFAKAKTWMLVLGAYLTIRHSSLNRFAPTTPCPTPTPVHTPPVPGHYAVPASTGYFCGGQIPSPRSC